MTDSLTDNHAILIEVEGDGGLAAWIIKPPDPEDPWPVSRPLPGMPAFRETDAEPLLSLARWLILICVGQEAVELCDFTLVQERLSREHSCLYSIPVGAVRRFVRNTLLARSKGQG